MRTLVYSVALLLAPMVITAAYGASPVTEKTLRGMWKEKSGDNVYVFSSNHEFEYRYPTHRYVNNIKQEWIESETGAWQFGTEMCEFGKQKGNLMIHLGTKRCCHIAFFLGANLVLNTVSPQQFDNVCSDRVLVKQAPQDAAK